jgi:hypothetical protein
MARDVKQSHGESWQGNAITLGLVGVVFLGPAPLRRRRGACDLEERGSLIVSVAERERGRGACSQKEKHLCMRSGGREPEQACLRGGEARARCWKSRHAGPAEDCPEASVRREQDVSRASQISAMAAKEDHHVWKRMEGWHDEGDKMRASAIGAAVAAMDMHRIATSISGGCPEECRRPPPRR